MKIFFCACCRKVYTALRHHVCNMESEQTVKSMDEEDEMSGDDEDGNAGWADVMDKILRTGCGPQEPSVAKKRQRKSYILAKARTDTEIAAKLNRKTDDFEIAKAEDGDKEATTDTKNVEKKTSTDEMTLKEMKKKLKEKRLQKAAFEMRSRKKPDITQRQKEKALQRIATKGVVQLFNAIRQRQVTVEAKLKEVGQSEVKKEKVLKAMTKQDFLESIKSSSKSVKTEDGSSSRLQKSKSEVTTADDNKPTWSILRDDYMMGAQMKDWDKESDSEEEEIF